MVDLSSSSFDLLNEVYKEATLNAIEEFEKANASKVMESVNKTIDLFDSRSAKLNLNPYVKERIKENLLGRAAFVTSKTNDMGYQGMNFKFECDVQKEASTFMFNVKKNKSLEDIKKSIDEKNNNLKKSSKENEEENKEYGLIYTSFMNKIEQIINLYFSDKFSTKQVEYIPGRYEREESSKTNAIFLEEVRTEYKHFCQNTSPLKDKLIKELEIIDTRYLQVIDVAIKKNNVNFITRGNEDVLRKTFGLQPKVEQEGLETKKAM